MKQNDAVFSAVCSVLNLTSFDDAVVLTKEQKESVVSIVTQGILSGDVDFSETAKARYDTEAKTRGYVGGMVSNHLRKDKRLNGNTKYEIQNPGSRAGTGNSTIKALKQLRSTITDEDQVALIDSAIFEELEKHKSSKMVEINISALPEEFRHLVK